MITLSDHQWEAVGLAADWYDHADKHRYEFEFPQNSSLEQLTGKRRMETMLGKGQDFFFGGYAGTGKTTVLPAVIEKFGLDPNTEVAFVAPTGKAAKVMGEKLRAFGMQVTPTTIHKLIYLPKAERADAIKRRIDSLSTAIFEARRDGGASVPYWDKDALRMVSLKEAEVLMKDLNFELIRAMDSGEGPRFQLRAKTDFPEHFKLIVCDEGSMVGAEVANDLASFGLPILVFGDPGQLPPVSDEYGFACENPDAFLTEIHRQAADNPIIYLATRARNGLDIKVGDYGNGVTVIERRNDTATYDMSREAMVLCGTHKKRWGLTKKIRTALGYTETGPCEGEPLLICKNSQKLPILVNGTLVTCMTDYGDLNKGDASFRLKVQDDDSPGLTQYEIEVVQGLFEEHLQRERNAYSCAPQSAFHAKKTHEHVDWGHVLTVHKSQGSQWDDVIVHDESGAFRDAGSRWLYTGITRAAKTLTLVV